MKQFYRALELKIKKIWLVKEKELFLSSCFIFLNF